jgi:hypothetical protein
MKPSGFLLSISDRLARNYRHAVAFGVLLCTLLLAACELAFDSPLKSFFEEQTGTIALEQIAPEAGQAIVGSDGYVCLLADEADEVTGEVTPGTHSFSIPIDNPQGYALVVESSFEQTLGAGISGITVTQADANHLTVTIPAGAVKGNEGTLHIKVRSAKEGRILYEGDIGIAFFENFDTSLTEIKPETPNRLHPEEFKPDIPNYSISNFLNAFDLSVKAANPAALITIDGVTGIGSLKRSITPDANISTVVIQVELRHGAAARNYSIVVNRVDPDSAGSAYLVVSQEPDTRFYRVQAAPDTGLDTAGLKISLVTGLGSEALASGQYSTSCDFSSPGRKTVTVTYNNSLPAPITTGFEVWVVGLANLAVSGQDYTPLFSPSVTAYTLPQASYATNSLNITATSGLEDASLTIRGVSATSGVSTSIPLDPGDNPVNIKVSRGGVNMDYTVNVFRVSLGVSEFYVSGTGGSPAGSDTDGDGTAGLPFATVEKALSLVNGSGLPSTDTFTIIVSGTVSPLDSNTSDNMADISGSNYPQIVLRGKGTGPDAGVLDAGGNKRVLYITGGNIVTLGANLTLKGGSASSFGGGVYVNNSTFNMTGGVIEDNTAPSGGGVYVSVTGGGSSAFNMSGNAIIKGNEFSSFGGGVYVNGSGSTFNMSGNASIQENETTSGSSNGGGVHVSNSTFNMSEDASIHDNKARYGGGVSVYGASSIFDMTGNASIYDNESSTSGGGVYVSSGTFGMTGNVSIYGNESASYGGGVYISGSSSLFTMTGSAIIRDNKALSSNGGGVYVSSGTFTMSGGTIQGNIAETVGGGIFIFGSGDTTFSKTGGTITGSNASPGEKNTAINGFSPNFGHAVYVTTTPRKKRDTTAGTGVNLYAKYHNSDWSFIDVPPPAGAGDTTSNWE